MKDNLKFEVLQLCSGHFLTKHFPNNWDELTQTEQDKFLSENCWEPLEHLDSNFLYETIENSAIITQRFIENLKGETTND